MGRTHAGQATRQKQVRRAGDFSGEPFFVHAPAALDSRRNTGVSSHSGTRPHHRGTRGILPSQGPGFGHARKGRPLRGFVQKAPLSGPVRLFVNCGRQQNQYLQHSGRCGPRGKRRLLSQTLVSRKADSKPDSRVFRTGLQQQRNAGRTIPSLEFCGGGRWSDLVRVYDRTLRFHSRRRFQVVPRSGRRNQGDTGGSRSRSAGEFPRVAGGVLFGEFVQAQR
mmetsp:Transcript_816/g.1866  ORF Transcript_816/g.1866 Transcript_816/m.1866 type:complete len:222 (-) Transcript_816:985-1650(-)